MVSNWGSRFLVAFGLVSALYVGGGLAHGGRSGRAPQRHGLSSAHPHAEQWRSLQGLVRDGVVFARARAQGHQPGRAAGSAAPLLEVEEERRNRGGSSGGKEKTSKQRSGKKESKEGSSPQSGGERTSKRSSGGDRGNDAAAAPAPVTSAGPAAAGTQAGDGGRWVHVPN